MIITKNNILDELYRSEFMESFLSKITSDHYLKEDLRQELFLILCKMNDKKIIDLYENNELKYYVIRIAKNNYHSSTSPFHKKYRNTKLEYGLELEDIDIDTNFHFEKLILESNKRDEMSDKLRRLIKMIDTIVESDLHWYNQGIFNMYFKKGKWDKIDGEFRDLECGKEKSTYRRIEEITKIDHTSVFLTMKESIEIIKNKLKENDVDGEFSEFF